MGPQEGLHDFVLGQTASRGEDYRCGDSFPAKISSLEQLDGSTGLSIFLAGVKIGLQETGLTLPERIETIRALLAPDIAGPYLRLTTSCGIRSVRGDALRTTLFAG